MLAHLKSPGGPQGFGSRTPRITSMTEIGDKAAHAENGYMVVEELDEHGQSVTAAAAGGTPQGTPTRRRCVVRSRTRSTHAAHTLHEQHANRFVCRPQRCQQLTAAAWPLQGPIPRAAAAAGVSPTGGLDHPPPAPTAGLAGAKDRTRGKARRCAAVPLGCPAPPAFCAPVGLLP